MFLEDKKSVMYASSPPKSGLGQLKQSLWPTASPFCDQCIQNQQKILQLLADYLPEDHVNRYFEFICRTHSIMNWPKVIDRKS